MRFGSVPLIAGSHLSANWANCTRLMESLALRDLPLDVTARLPPAPTAAAVRRVVAVLVFGAHRITTSQTSRNDSTRLQNATRPGTSLRIASFVAAYSIAIAATRACC